MNYIRKIIFILLIFISCVGNCKAERSVQQDLTGILREVLEIEAARINTSEYFRDAPFGTNLKIVTVNKSNQQYYILSLIHIDIQVHTNMGSPIYVNADFVSFRKLDGTHTISQQDLYFIPHSISVDSPYDHMWVGGFTPTIITRNTTMSGDYRGEVLFTLGAI